MIQIIHFLKRDLNYTWFELYFFLNHIFLKYIMVSTKIKKLDRHVTENWTHLIEFRLFDFYIQ